MRLRFDLRPGNRHLKPRLRNLRDVAVANEAIIVTCRDCRHQATLLPIDLAERVGADFPVAGLERRLRCTKCRAKGRVRVYESVR